MLSSKHSRQRDKILEVLRCTKSHPTASNIYDMVREDIPNISLGTVYRNLNKLSRSGQILRLDFGEGCEHFDGDISPHYHVVCTKCRLVADIYAYETALSEYAKKYFKGNITGHSLVFYGECENCLEKI